MAEARIILTSVGLMEKAEQIANTLVERRLAACVNIVGPIRSIYRWQDSVQREQEYLLLIKTTAERAATLATVFAEIHPTNCRSTSNWRLKAEASHTSNGWAHRSRAIRINRREEF